jgi:uncharacterized protein DUF4326
MAPVRLRKLHPLHWPASPNGLPNKLVARPAIIGNPYRVEDYGRLQAIELYKLWLFETLIRGDWQAKKLLSKLREAAGCNLLCYCQLTEDCHADWLLELLNPFPEQRLKLHFSRGS